MALTMLAIPFLILGVFINPYTQGAERCFNLNFISKTPFCFEASSNMPEIVQYGSLMFAFVLIYTGRHLMRRGHAQK
ncbi:MAG: hypothetical protein Q8M26_11325 [Pseudolabrys sp.]|nr:hypothetical protein [Pseudolabrys sp.]